MVLQGQLLRPHRREVLLFGRLALPSSSLPSLGSFRWMLYFTVEVARKSTYQEIAKGGFGKGGFCRIQRHARENQEIPKHIGPRVHSALRTPQPREEHIFAKTPSENPLLKTAFSWFLNLSGLFLSHLSRMWLPMIFLGFPLFSQRSQWFFSPPDRCAENTAIVGKISRKSQKSSRTRKEKLNKATWKNPTSTLLFQPQTLPLLRSRQTVEILGRVSLESVWVHLHNSRRILGSSQELSRNPNPLASPKVLRF